MDEEDDEIEILFVGNNNGKQGSGEDHVRGHEQQQQQLKQQQRQEHIDKQPSPPSALPDQQAGSEEEPRHLSEQQQQPQHQKQQQPIENLQFGLSSFLVNPIAPTATVPPSASTSSSNNVNNNGLSHQQKKPTRKRKLGKGKKQTDQHTKQNDQHTMAPIDQPSTSSSKQKHNSHRHKKHLNNNGKHEDEKRQNNEHEHEQQQKQNNNNINEGTAPHQQPLLTNDPSSASSTTTSSAPPLSNKELHARLSANLLAVTQRFMDDNNFNFDEQMQKFMLRAGIENENAELKEKVQKLETSTQVLETNMQKMETNMQKLETENGLMRLKLTMNRMAMDRALAELQMTVDSLKPFFHLDGVKRKKISLVRVAGNRWEASPDWELKLDNGCWAKRRNLDWANLRTQKPFVLQHLLPAVEPHQQHRLYYYEVEILKMACGMAFGLSGPNFPFESSECGVGGLDGSFGVNCDRVYWAAGEEHREDFCPNSMEQGDVVGCGLLAAVASNDTERVYIFFTKNGQIFVKPTLVPDDEADMLNLYPTVTSAKDAQLMANFGADLETHPFRYNLAGLEVIDL